MVPETAQTMLLEAFCARTASNDIFPDGLGPWEYAGSIQDMRKPYPRHHLQVLRMLPRKVGFWGTDVADGRTGRADRTNVRTVRGQSATVEFFL